MPRVFLADTLLESRSALRLVLVEMGMQVVGEAADWQNTLELAPKTQPDILVVDWALVNAGSTGVALEQLRTKCPHLHIVVLGSSLEDRYAALRAGSDEFISKGDAPDRVTERLRAAACGVRP